MNRIQESKASPAQRRQIEIDAEIDDLLDSGQNVDDQTLGRISDHHRTLLRASGMYRSRNGWRLPNVD